MDVTAIVSSSTLAADPEWGPYLTARSQLVADLADTVHQNALIAGSRPGWVTAGVGQPPGQTIADIAVWRAAMSVPEADLRPTGERQLPKAAARWQHHLEHRLAGDQYPAVREWGPLLHQLAPAVAGDDFTPLLAQRLAALSSAGINARGLLQSAVAEGVLPDDHAAAAIWWRIARHLTPDIATAVQGDQPLTAVWTTTLADTIGADRADELQSSPWWPALVAAVDHGIQQGWTPSSLLDTSAPATDANLDECLALVWRISILTNPPQAYDDEPPVPDAHDEPPADLWHGHQPSDPIQTASAVEPQPGAEQQPMDERGVSVEEDDGPDLMVEAMIRNTLGTPEPTKFEIERMMAHADAWRDSPAGPERLAHINQLAADFYQACYPGSWAQPYLTGRLGTDLAGNPDFRPGYAPASWNALITHLHRHGVTDTEMLTAGVATTASTGRLIDRFRDRAVFPIIHNQTVLGFVGRRHPHYSDQDQAGPKYLNTADTPLFHKGDQLFAPGRLLAAGAIPVIVEGPIDAIAVTLATDGRYVGVAPLGTALTDDQAAQLHHLGHRQPIVATDADLPGRVAAERDYWILTPHGHHPLYAQLPDRTDPADLTATGNRAGLVEALAGATPLAELLIEERLAHLPPAEAALEAVRIVAAQPPDRWETGAHHIADQLRLPASLIQAALKDLVNAWNRDPRAAAQIPLHNANVVKARLAQDTDHTLAETVNSGRPDGVHHQRQNVSERAQVTARGIDR